MSQSNRWMRRTHRAVSAIFMLFVLVNLALTIGGFASEEVATGVGLLTLLPLLFLSITGCYLFVLPYLARGREDPKGS